MRGVDIEITGSINVDGADGTADVVNLQGTGGGSGGTALVTGRFVIVTGSVSAQGGDGGTSANPTFGGGETGRLARSTPVSTGASAEGCHPIHSQMTNAAVVATLKRRMK